MIDPAEDESSPPVLEYEVPRPRLPWHLVARDQFLNAIDACGGPDATALVLALIILWFGSFISGRAGVTLIIVGGALIQISLRYWAKNSRY